MKRPAPYVPLSAHYADDERIVEIGEAAELMYLRMLAYAARTPRTEGWVSEVVILTRLGLLEREGEPDSAPRARLKVLKASGLIVAEGSGWRIAGWLKWNRSAEQMDRERAQDRNRKKAPTSTNTGKRPENCRNVVGIRGAEADTEADTEGTTARKRATRIPDGFAVTDPMRQWAAANGAAQLDLEAITDEFVDYWRGVVGAKGVKADWMATWRNWIRRKLEDHRLRQPAQANRSQQPEGW